MTPPMPPRVPPLLLYNPTSRLSLSHHLPLHPLFRAETSTTGPQPSIMSDQSKPVTQKLYDTAPSSRQVVKFLTAATIGTILLVLSGLTLTGTVIALIIATPALVVFSPILVPAGIVIFLATTGFLFSGCCGVTALMALSWLYEYVAGKHPPGADQLDYARMRIANKARDMKERAKEYGQYVHHKAQEATQGS